MRDSILVINGKGGCGKTTVATNLAAGLAGRGRTVALMDHERESSATDWIRHRTPDLPPITLTGGASSMYQTTAFSLRIPPGHDFMVIDGTDGIGDTGLDSLLRQVDLVLVPVMPSPFDVEATVRFIATLKANRFVRQRRIALALVVVRVSARPDASVARIAERVRDLGLPCAAAFRDRGIYNIAAERGVGVTEAARTLGDREEAAVWDQFVTWVEDREGWTTGSELSASRSMEQPVSHIVVT